MLPSSIGSASRYPSSYINISGSLSSIVSISQLSSGILLSIHHNNFFTIAFDSIIYILININNGWLIRILHVIGASLSTPSSHSHSIRFIWIKLKIINIQFITFIIVIIGWIISIFPSIEGSSGHLPCRGQMSYWGTTATTNIIVTLPCCGIVIAKSTWNAAWVTSNRIFVHHFLIGIFLVLSILIHIIFPHNFSSSNPSINNNTITINFYPFIFKDLYISIITINIIIAIFFYWEPDILGNSDNQIIANPLITPNNILPVSPEWSYYSTSNWCCNKIIDEDKKVQYSINWYFCWFFPSMLPSSPHFHFILNINYLLFISMVILFFMYSFE